MKLRLQRVDIRREGAFGVLIGERGPFSVTLERTYDELDETGRQSTKIPPGLWLCTRTVYLRGNYGTYEIQVPGHSRLLFHKGNLEDESEGCVLVAESFDELHGRPAILGSAKGFSDFMHETHGVEVFDLEVRE